MLFSFMLLGEKKGRNAVENHRLCFKSREKLGKGFQSG